MTNPIHIWGYASGCPACTNLKALLDILKVPYVFHEITQEGAERAALKDAGFRTVPQVFTAEGIHLGDWSGYRGAAVAAIETLSTP